MLRNKLLGLVAFGLLTSTTLKAERKQFSVHGNLGVFFTSPMVIGYGGGLSYRATDGFGLGIEYIGFSGGVSNLSASFGLIPLDFRFYLVDGNFYIGPNVGLAMLNVTASGITGFTGGSMTTFLIGGTIGYEWDFYQSNSINIGIAPEFRVSMVAIMLPVMDASVKVRVSF